MLLRRVARPLLAAIFVSGGINELRDPGGHAEAVRPFLDLAKGSLPTDFDADNPTLVQVDGAVKVGAGTLLALGRFPRLSALLLAGSLVPTTVGAHAFWEIDDGEERANQQIQFFKNAGMLGGLLLAAADTGGKPSLTYQAKQARQHAEREVERRGSDMSRRARKARKHAEREVERRGSDMSRRARKVRKHAERRGSKTAQAARQGWDDGTRKGRKAAKRAMR